MLLAGLLIWSFPTQRLMNAAGVVIEAVRLQLSLQIKRIVNGYRNPPKSGGKDGLRFLVWRALLRGAEMELLNRHADVGGKKD